MDYLSIIRRPIEAEMSRFGALFDEALSSPDPMVGQVLSYIRGRVGKRMRPMLVMLTARVFGAAGEATQRAAVGLELLHTASLVHDDVVDESDTRRGQPSVHAVYGNKVAVLVGDYLLSTALLNVSLTRNHTIVDYLSELGRTLSKGEILQLSTTRETEISEAVYYDVIRQKTAALFEACCSIGALSAGAPPELVAEARQFGSDLGLMFQIRDDIFDYYTDDIGKPTGNDMAEGKLTLPAIYAINSTGDKQMADIAAKVRRREVASDDIARLVDFTKAHGGIEYAMGRMHDFRQQAMRFIDDRVGEKPVRDSFMAYIDFVVNRKY